MNGTVTQAQFRGDGYALSIALDDAAAPVTVQMTSEARVRAGDRIGLVVEPQGLRWFTAGGNKPTQGSPIC
jgi:hypothetical protein